MNGQIECAMTGRLAQEVQLRTSKSGKARAVEALGEFGVHDPSNQGNIA